jgi:NNP family nitrate/nitrite transporter-like MFS transporter
LLSDKYGRKRTLVVILAGLSVSYFLMGQIDNQWSVLAAVAITIICSLFVNAGNGAVFAVVPLVKRRLTGQVAGMSGAYGNVGAVCFLTVLSFVSPQMFFFVIGGAALFSLLAALFFMEEPSGQMAEIMPDGTVQMIDVA